MRSRVVVLCSRSHTEIFSERMPSHGSLSGNWSGNNTRRNNMFSRLSESPAKTLQDKRRSEDAVSPRPSQHTGNLQSDPECRYSHVE
jgi:hypothetical protein